MSKIKTRDSARGIKALDRVKAIGERMRKAFIRTKEKTADLIDDGHNSVDEYAADKVQIGTEEAVVETGRTAAAAPKRIYDRVHGRKTPENAKNVASINQPPVRERVATPTKQSSTQSEDATMQNRSIHSVESKSVPVRSNDIPPAPLSEKARRGLQTADKQEQLYGDSTTVEHGQKPAKNDTDKHFKQKEPKAQMGSNDSTISADSIKSTEPSLDSAAKKLPAFSPKEERVVSSASQLRQQPVNLPHEQSDSIRMPGTQSTQEPSIHSGSTETVQREQPAKVVSKNVESKTVKSAEPMSKTARQGSAGIPKSKKADPQLPAIKRSNSANQKKTPAGPLLKNVKSGTEKTSEPMKKTQRRRTVSRTGSETENSQRPRIRSRITETGQQQNPEKTTSDNIEIRTMKSPEHTIKTAQRDIKQSERAVKNAQETAKAAASSVKTASVTVTYSQRAAQAAQTAAQKAETATKSVARATTKAIKAIGAKMVDLVAAIAAGGGIAVLAVVIICLIGCIVASPFGIFFAGENRESGSVNLSAAVAQIQYDFNERLEELQAGEYDTIEFEGTLADWPELISVFAVKVADADGTDAMDVATLDAKRLQKLSDVFWDANEISSRVDIIEHEDSDPEDDVDDSWAESILHIEVSAMTSDELMEKYRFSDKQKQLYAELMEERTTLESLLGDTVVMDAETQGIIQNLPDDLPPERRAIVKTACSLVGKVNYFWGGKSLVFGWDSRWGSIQKVTAEDSSTTGTYRPYGLDCSGFVDWVFYNTTDGAYYPGHGGGAAMQHGSCIPTIWENAEPGDLVFYPEDDHVGIVAGFDEDGEILIIHCDSGYNNVVITGKSGFEAVGKPEYY